MRRILTVASVAVLLTLSTMNAKAVTITGSLLDLNASNTAIGSIHSIEVLLFGTQTTGIQGTGFNIISDGTGHASFPGGAANTIEGPNLAADGYGFVKPSGTDASNYANYLGQPPPATFPLSDGDLDAIGGSLAGAPGSVDSDPADGMVMGSSGLPEVLATEKWTFSATETLSLYLVGPQYYADTTGEGATGYDTVVTSGVTVTIVPEPASMILLGLGGLGLAFAARRRS